MSQGHEICKNSDFISIRKAAARNMVSNTNKDEKAKSPTLSLETLRTIGAIVRAIRERIDSADHQGDTQQEFPANPGSNPSCPVGGQGNA